MSRSRRLSHVLSEGDGISVIVCVADAAAARAAEEDGADGVAVAPGGQIPRDAVSLPVLARGDDPEAARRAGADACVLVAERLGDELAERHELATRLGLECVVDVSDDEEIAHVLELLDPEIFLLSPRDAEDDEEPLDRVLSLLPDVPAGKLAIAEVEVAGRHEVVALERAGFDAVLVARGDVAEIVGGGLPDV